MEHAKQDQASAPGVPTGKLSDAELADSHST
jgi:hypothetical protein